jgi:hypothetical protein
MAIPKIAIPTFDVTLLTTNETVRMRPFVVKEEKLLIMAAESGETREMIRAMQDVITACSNEIIDGTKLPFFELQNIFIKLRSNSIGEESEFNLVCGNCEDRRPFTLNLSDIQPKFFEGHTKKIPLTDDVGVIMRYPTASEALEGMMDTLDMVATCIDVIYTNEESVSTKDENPNDIKAFVNDLTPDLFAKIAEFFVTIPRIEHTIEYVCEKCEQKNTIIVDGIESFFD